MDITEIFAKRLVKLREDNNITQQALADDLGITRQSLSLYEKTDRTINIYLLHKIAKRFNVSTDYLLGLQKEPTNDLDVIAVTEYTALSKEAAEKLHEIGLHNKSTANSDTLSALIEDVDFKYFLALLSAKMYDDNSTQRIVTGNAQIQIKVSSLTNYEIGQSIAEISTRMKDKFEEKYKTVDERQEHLFHQEMYRLAEGLLKENRITEQEYNQIIAEYDNGNFEYGLGRKV
ncbi:MAG: helix-turn-helix domain-containing protein [Oscillospiraceae bacterium]|nr:helix-turn-helix domain-containing protein [Oscillospiraceae bacterium]